MKMIVYILISSNKAEDKSLYDVGRTEKRFRLLLFQNALFLQYDIIYVGYCFHFCVDRLMIDD